MFGLLVVCPNSRGATHYRYLGSGQGSESLWVLNQSELIAFLATSLRPEVWKSMYRNCHWFSDETYTCMVAPCYPNLNSGLLKSIIRPVGVAYHTYIHCRTMWTGCGVRWLYIKGVQSDWKNMWPQEQLSLSRFSSDIPALWILGNMFVISSWMPRMSFIWLDKGSSSENILMLFIVQLVK